MAALPPPLLKAAASFAVSPTKAGIRKLTMRWRVARAASKQAKREGIGASSGALRKWLKRDDVKHQLVPGTAGGIESAVSSLAHVISGESGPDRRVVAERVLFLVLVELIKAYDPAAATALSASWLSVQISNVQSSLDAVAETTTTILERLADPTIFRADLRKLHPWREVDATEIARHWPQIMPMVHTIVTADDRGAVLTEWSSTPLPILADAPWPLWAWLGAVAADYGQGHAARSFIDRAIALGAFPRAYWRARAALGVADDGESARELLQDPDADPLAIALRALVVDSDFTTAEKALIAWVPEQPNDKAIRAQLLAESHRAAGDLNGAISIARAAADEDPQASGPALRAAEMLLTRGYFGLSDHPMTDIAAAFDLAIRVRNVRRQWSGNSAAAVLTAMKAAALNGDVDRAWRLSQAAPAGEATKREAVDHHVRAEAATLAALAGRLVEAGQLARELRDPYISAAVDAYRLSAEGDNEAAIEAWLRAWTHAPDDASMLRVANELAEIGGELPDLAELESRHADAVSEIRLIAEGMGAGDRRIIFLRAKEAESPRLSVLLAGELRRTGEHAEAARVLQDAARRWSQPLLMRMAARQFLTTGEYAAAEAACDEAFVMAGLAWSGQFETGVIRLEALEAQGEFQRATDQARQLVGLDANDRDARWALIRCLVRAGDLAGAWHALTPEGSPIDPRTVEDADVLIGLAARFDESPLFLSRALEVMKLWPDDEQFLGRALVHIRMKLREIELASEDLEALQQATDDYVNRFPDSAVLRIVESTADDPLAGINEVLRNSHQMRAPLKGLEQRVRSGDLPLGILAELVNRTYLEVSVKRGAGMVLSAAPERSDQARSAVQAALDQRVAIDTTAACTLAVLPEKVRVEIIGAFSRLESTDRAYHDALQGEQSLEMRSTMFASWDAESQTTHFSTIDDEQAEALAETAALARGILFRTRRHPWPKLKHLVELQEPNEWLATLDMAATESISFWCDDVRLGVLATSEGVPTFGTVDILRTLHHLGRIDVETLGAAEGTLLRNYHVDLGYREAAMRYAAELDGWAPGGASFSLTRPATWSSPAQTMAFLRGALKRQLIDPEHLGGWISAAAFGITRLAGDDTTAANSNLQILFNSLLSESWIDADRFPFVVAGVRAPTKDNPDLADPVGPVLAMRHGALVKQHGAVRAQQLLFALVAKAGETDKHLAARIVLTN